MITMMSKIKMKNFQITLDDGKGVHYKVRFSAKIVDVYSRIVNNSQYFVRSIEGGSVDLRLKDTTENTNTLLPFNNRLCLDCEYLPTCLNVTSCIQKSIEGQQTPCMKEEVKKDIHNFIRRTVLGKTQQLLLTLLFFLCSSSLFAQPSNITFSGNVKDNNGTPVVGAIATLQSLTDSTYTKVVATNDQGIFRFDSIQKRPLHSKICLIR